MNLKFVSYDYLPKEAKQIRTTVFVKEQGFVDEFNEDDEKSIHILLFLDNKAIATARIIYSSRHNCYTIGRFAVLNEYRKKGYGSKLIEFTEKQIIKRYGHIQIGIGAQERAKLFYEKCGYSFSGEKYLDENYPHYWMIKQL